MALISILTISHTLIKTIQIYQHHIFISTCILFFVYELLSFSFIQILCKAIHSYYRKIDEICYFFLSVGRSMMKKRLGTLYGKNFLGFILWPQGILFI